MLIRILETLFYKTMRDYWYKARKTGYKAGINSATYIIQSEIKHLKSKKKTKENDIRISELNIVDAIIKAIL